MWQACQSDPFLDFIHDTFGATAIRLPDPRWTPLTVFVMREGRLRYLGHLADLTDGRAPALPLIHDTSLPSVETQCSSSFSARVAVDLLGPLLSKLVGLLPADLEASLEVARTKRMRMSISLGKTRRKFVNPIALGQWFDDAKPVFPTGLDLGDHRTYVIDSILQAKKLTLSIESGGSAEVTASLEMALAPTVKPDALVRTDRRVTLEAPQSAPFALTSLCVLAAGGGAPARLEVAATQAAAAATPIALLMPATRPTLAGSNQFVAFDD